MSILIKDMEMPKNCALCKLRGAGETWCPFTLREVPGNTIPEDCPLVPVPPHGRLGDLDAVEAEIREKTNEQFCVNIVHAAPTIVPAEENNNDR